MDTWKRCWNDFERVLNHLDAWKLDQNNLERVWTSLGMTRDSGPGGAISKFIRFKIEHLNSKSERFETRSDA